MSGALGSFVGSAAMTEKDRFALVFGAGGVRFGAMATLVLFIVFLRPPRVRGAGGRVPAVPSDQPHDLHHLALRGDHCSGRRHGCPHGNRRLDRGGRPRPRRAASLGRQPGGGIRHHGQCGLLLFHGSDQRDGQRDGDLRPLCAWPAERRNHRRPHAQRHHARLPFSRLAGETGFPDRAAAGPAGAKLLARLWP